MSSETKNYNIKKEWIVFAVVLFAVSFAVYFKALSNGFVYDDTYVIIENPWIKDPGSIKDIFLSSAWSFQGEGESSTNYYRPMLHLFLMGGYHIFGLSSSGFHTINLLMHSLNTVLVFFIAAFLFSKRGGSDKDRLSIVGPLLAASIFMLHPVNAEPVNWLSSLSDLQFAFFTLAAFYFYLRSKVPFRDPAFFISLALFLPALLSKETAMALIPMIFLYDYFFRMPGDRGESRVGGFTRYIPFIIIAILYLVLRSYSFTSIAMEKKLDISFYESMLAVAPLLSAYFGKLLFPISLNALYPYYHISSIADMRVIISIIVLAAYLFLLFFTWRLRIVPFVLLWIVIPILPVLYIPVLTAAPFAERYLYLSTVAFAILYSFCFMKVILSGVHKSGEGRGKVYIVLALCVTALLLGFFLVKVQLRSNVWKSDLTLWSDTVEKSPESSTAYYNLGWAYQRLNDNENAEASYLKSLRLGPMAVDARYNIAQIYMQSGRYQDALKEFRVVMKIDPDYKKTRKFLKRIEGKLK